MTGRGSSAVTLVVAWLALLAFLSPLPAEGAALFEVEAPEELAPLAASIRDREAAEFHSLQTLIGIPVEPPFHVALYTEKSEHARHVPSWISGYTIGDRRSIVLFPARASTYPNDGFEELLRHEMAHVLIDRAARGNPVPRWFHEGLATAAAGTWGPGDRALITLATIRGVDATLASIEEGFRSSDPATIRTSYVISFAFVRFLLNELGPGSARRILDQLSLGYDFESAFRQATGVSLRYAERRFQRRRSIWNRWVPVLTSSVFLWIVVSMLAMVAWGRKKRRDAKILARWDEAERWEERRRIYPSDDEPIN